MNPAAGNEALPFDAAHTPRHIAIIMDGNGRWARERELPRIRGHEAGAESVRKCVSACAKWGVEALTLYAFSTENWSRPKTEVRALMLLLRNYLKRERKELARQNIRLRAIGDLERLSTSARKELDRTIDELSGNTGLTLVLALSYGSRDEITWAVRKLAEKCVAGEITPAEIDEESISATLDTGGLPDPDLLIRTAGEMRVSNFLLWQISYCEYYSASACWPDFDETRLAEAIRVYQQRQRTFGKIKEE